MPSAARLRKCVFRAPDTDEARSADIASITQNSGYGPLNRPDKGVVLRYMIATCAYLIF